MCLGVGYEGRVGCSSFLVEPGRCVLEPSHGPVQVTSYDIVVKDAKHFNRVNWQYMILDEAQAIKSSSSTRWNTLLKFNCRNRLLLTGTPIQNTMAELWALLHFIMPTLFDSHNEFNEWFSKDIESHAQNKTSRLDSQQLSRLHMILKPFMLRRIKRNVENELPDKVEIMIKCPLSVRQQRMYRKLKTNIKRDQISAISGKQAAPSRRLVRSEDKALSSLLNLVMQFRKVCNHPNMLNRRPVRSPLALAPDPCAVSHDSSTLVANFPSAFTMAVPKRVVDELWPRSRPEAELFDVDWLGRHYGVVNSAHLGTSMTTDDSGLMQALQLADLTVQDVVATLTSNDMERLLLARVAAMHAQNQWRNPAATATPVPTHRRLLIAIVPDVVHAGNERTAWGLSPLADLSTARHYRQLLRAAHPEVRGMGQTDQRQSI